MSAHAEVAALDIADIKRTFNRGTANERLALAGVTLALKPGDFAVLIGGNGAGKSTLLNAVAGEVLVDDGRIAICGRDVTTQPTHARTDLVARVFQDPLIGTAGAMTIEENLALAERRGQRHRLRRGLSETGRRRYRDTLATLHLGLEDRLTQKVELLSGGQRQSLALAMSILTAPALLLLDEHTAALDPRTADLVMRATIEAIERAHLTALMVTHNMQHAIDYGNRLIMMAGGRVIYEAVGAEKQALTVPGLIERFHITSERMILA